MDLPAWTSYPNDITVSAVDSDALQVQYFAPICRTENVPDICKLSIDPLDVFEVFRASFSWPECQIIRAAMLASSSVICGSSTMAALAWISKPPANLDIVGGSGSLSPIQCCLRNFGFISEEAEVLPHFLATVETVTVYRRKNWRSVSVVECKATTIWKHILSSPSTAHAAFISATHSVILYPDFFAKKVALMRSSNFPPVMESHPVYRRLKDLGVTTYRLNSWAQFPPSLSCPGLQRSLWGGRGIYHASWSGVLDAAWDYYYQLCAKGFESSDLLYTWQFAVHCSDWNCPYSWMSTQLAVDGYI